MLKYLASFLLVCLAVRADAASRVQCGAMTSKYVPGRIGYCAMLPPSYRGIYADHPRLKELLAAPQELGVAA